MRQVAMLSLKKNEYMISEKDVPWLFERLRSENDLAGVALVQNPNEDLAAVAAPPSAADSQDAAVAAPPSAADSQESMFSTESEDAQTPEKTCRPQPSEHGASSAQGSVDVGYKCQWTFPSKGDLGTWEATVTRAGALHGNVVVCSVAKFTRVKWLQVYCAGRERPCSWHKATPLQLKECCRLYVEAHMDKILADCPAEDV